MPISDHLHTFICNVKRLEDEDFHGEDGFYREFQDLKRLSSELRSDNLNYPTSHGQKEINRKKNRYKDILPFDKTRVVLPEQDGSLCSDYINANFIQGVSRRSTYIAAQGPLVSSVNDFWRMLWTCQIEVVLMACKEYEQGKHKCQRYWADDDGEKKMYGDITVELDQQKLISSDFVVRKLIASRGGVSRVVYQYHYNAWPDHGVPKTLTPIFDMITLMRKHQSCDETPIVVHCSAGCGRTGTICAIDYVWSMLKSGNIDESFSLFDIIASMRRQRQSMVQTKEQYEFVHDAVKELFERHLDIINKHSYQNVSFGDRNQPILPGVYENLQLNSERNEEGEDTSAPSDVVIRKTSLGLIAIEESGEIKSTGAPPPKPPLSRKPLGSSGEKEQPSSNNCAGVSKQSSHPVNQRRLPEQASSYENVVTSKSGGLGLEKGSTQQRNKQGIERMPSNGPPDFSSGGSDRKDISVTSSSTMISGSSSSLDKCEASLDIQPLKDGAQCQHASRKQAVPSSPGAPKKSQHKIADKLNAFSTYPTQGHYDHSNSETGKLHSASLNVSKQSADVASEKNLYGSVFPVSTSSLSAGISRTTIADSGSKTAEPGQEKKALRESTTYAVQGSASTSPRKNVKMTNEDLYQEVDVPDTRHERLTRSRTLSDDADCPAPDLPAKTAEAYKPLNPEDYQYSEKIKSLPSQLHTLPDNESASYPPVNSSRTLTNSSATLNAGLQSALKKLKPKNFFKRPDQSSTTVFHEGCLDDDERAHKNMHLSDFGTRVSKPVGPRKQPEKWTYL